MYVHGERPAAWGIEASVAGHGDELYEEGIFSISLIRKTGMKNSIVTALSVIKFL